MAKTARVLVELVELKPLEANLAFQTVARLAALDPSAKEAPEDSVQSPEAAAEAAAGLAVAVEVQTLTPAVPMAEVVEVAPLSPTLLLKTFLISKG
jgi:hypothetical protein